MEVLRCYLGDAHRVREGVRSGRAFFLLAIHNFE